MTRWTGSGLRLVVVAAALAAATARAETAAPPAPAAPPDAEVALTTEPAGDIPYDPAGRRDPFRPPRAGKTAHTGEQRTPLQRYEITQLRLAEVYFATKAPRAAVGGEPGLGY